jgi:hypothetical protein
MNLKLEKVFERDVDLLLLNSFINNKKFLACILNKFNLEGYQLDELEHSLMDNDGESDVTVILKKDDRRVALLIEDKIDAIAMPFQRDRYEIRGNKGIESKKYDDFIILIVAPQSYLESNDEAKKYDNKISYEELIEMMRDDFYAVSLLSQAIEEKKKGYVIVEDKAITEFWSHYYKFVKENYPRLFINEASGPRGGRANWPHFITPIKNVYIIHKSDRGYLDMTFNGMGEYYSHFMSFVKDKLDYDMSVHKTNKSMAIRLMVPIIDFKKDFEFYNEDMKMILNAALRLLDVLEKIDVKELYNIKN